MSRRRMGGRQFWAAIALGLVLGFFAAFAAFSLGRDGSPHSSAAAATPSTVSATGAFGQAQAATHGAGIRKPQIVPFIHTQRIGSSGPAVRELQKALIRAGVRPAKAKSTGFYGAITGRQVSAFQAKVKLSRSGVYGYPTHLKLSRYYTAPARGLLQQVAHSRKVVGYRNALRHAASVAWQHRSQMGYSQSITRGFLPSLPSFPRGTDCSGYATWLFKVSGNPISGLAENLPDPNGFNYRVVGYTGTLAQHGVRISSGVLKVGDLVFYGGGYPYGHVAIVVDAVRRLVTSHGQPGIKVVPWNYRTVSAVRRYFRTRRRRRRVAFA